MQTAEMAEDIARLGALASLIRQSFQHGNLTAQAEYRREFGAVAERLAQVAEVSSEPLLADRRAHWRAHYRAQFRRLSG